jgi:hypothetical protein
MDCNEHLWRGRPYNTQHLHEDQKLKNGWLQKEHDHQGPSTCPPRITH